MPWTKVYVDKSVSFEAGSNEHMRFIPYKDAIREAQKSILEKHTNAFLIGEGIDDSGGVFGSTRDLQMEFGAQRVIDIPIAENGLTGVAIGAAAAGMRPIFIHMRMDFLPMCMDQIVNHAAKWHYMSGGRINIPLVIRCLIGRGWGSAAQHSQALHALFMHIPGLKVVLPSTPYDAKGLLISSIEDGNPIIFVEHRWLYEYKGYVPDEYYSLPLGRGVIRKEGKDVTIVAFSLMVYEAVKAANLLEAEGISVEIVDPRTVKPLDEELIINSVKKTGRLVIADVACKTGGVGAEIACRIAESALEYLKGPVKRVNFADVPTPCSPTLENAYYPGSEDIATSVRELVNG